jgi:hypothetical protein
MATRKFHEYVADAAFRGPNKPAFFVEVSGRLNPLRQSRVVQQGALHLWTAHKINL